MQQEQIENRILDRLKTMNRAQKENLLELMDQLPRPIHSSKMYRRRAMKQIREAILLQA